MPVKEKNNRILVFNQGVMHRCNPCYINKQYVESRLVTDNPPL